MTETPKADFGGLIPARCPRCGGELAATAAGGFSCRYCGTDFLRADVLAGKGEDLRGFYQRAFTAFEDGDVDLAYGYFGRIVEINPREYEAWVGKGLAGLYKGFGADLLISAGELFSCLDAALRYYAGVDAAAFQKNLANRVGAAATDLYGRVMAAKANELTNLQALLRLLKYWEERGSEEEACWRATAAVAGEPAVPPKAEREPNTIYLWGKRPFVNIAREYADKVRAKYEPAFRADFERDAAANAATVREFKRFGKGALVGVIILAGVVLIILCVVLVVALGGFTYLRGRAGF